MSLEVFPPNFYISINFSLITYNYLEKNTIRNENWSSKRVSNNFNTPSSTATSYYHQIFQNYIEFLNKFNQFWHSILLAVLMAFIIKFNFGALVGYNLMVPFLMIETILLFINWKENVTNSSDNMFVMMFYSWLQPSNSTKFRIAFRVIRYFFQNFIIYCFSLIFISYFFN